MRLDIKDWAKTPDGIDTLGRQTVNGMPVIVCMDGKLWQGWKGVAIQVNENQITEKELESVLEKDDTIGDVLFRREQRMGSREDRKDKEMDKRRAEIRAEKHGVRQGIKDDKELGIPASAADIEQIGKMDQRMVRLTQRERSDELVRLRDKIAGRDSTKPVERLSCDMCGKVAPDSKNQERWLRGHKVGAHKPKVESAEA